MTPREWLQRANLKFTIGGRKDNTVVWIPNDFTYRPARGDTGLRLEERHFRGSLFPPLYRALEREVQDFTGLLLGDLTQRPSNTTLWEEAMGKPCQRRREVRRLMREGGLDPRAANAAEQRLNRDCHVPSLSAQALRDEEAVQRLARHIRSGGYSLQLARLKVDVRQLLEDEWDVPGVWPPVEADPERLTRPEQEDLERSEYGRG